jgi:hypothetical protein
MRLKYWCHSLDVLFAGMRSKWKTNERYDFDHSGVRIVHGNVDARCPSFGYLNI